MFTQLEIINDEALPAAEDFDPLLAERLLAARHIAYLAHGPILKTQGDDDIVLVGHLGIVRSNGQRIDSHRVRTNEKLHQVDEVTHLAQNSSTAPFRLRPVLPWQESGVDAVVDKQRSGHAPKNLSGQASEGRETPIVADHKSAV